MLLGGNLLDRSIDRSLRDDDEAVALTGLCSLIFFRPLPTSRNSMSIMRKRNELTSRGNKHFALYRGRRRLVLEEAGRYIFEYISSRLNVSVHLIIVNSFIECDLHLDRSGRGSN